MRMIVARIIGIAALAYLAGALQSAQAYIGPGAGITAIGTVVALIGALFLVVVGFLWYPIKRLRKALKARRERPDRRAEAS